MCPSENQGRERRAGISNVNRENQKSSVQEAGAASEPHRPPSPQANAHSDQGQGPATAHHPLETEGRALSPPPPPITPMETWALGPGAALQRPRAQASPGGPARQAPRNLGAGDMETKLLPHLQTRWLTWDPGPCVSPSLRVLHPGHPHPRPL